MKSNYKRIGDHIREIKAKNSDLTVTELLGINIDKFFMPSVANVIGTDLTNYKVVNKGQFACNRMHVGRDYRIPIAVSRSSMPFIVSPAYDVFEIEDSRILDSDYLMMWFSRKEFDRNAWFFTDADVRGGLPWKSFCDLELPIPHIDKQREIVKEYNSIINRIKLNEQLIQKLEETAQALYKQWFVEFEFPDENGMPYKSNGGEMQWNEELQIEIPSKWECTKIGNIALVVDCLHSKKPNQLTNGTGKILLQIENIGDYGLLDLSKKFFISESDYNLWTSRIELSEGDCILTNVGVDAIAQIPLGVTASLGRNMTGVRCKSEFQYPSFLITTLLSNSMKKEIENNKDTGTIMQALNVSSIPNLRFVIGTQNILHEFEYKSKILRKHMELLYKQNLKLKELTSLLLSKLATVG